MKNYENVVKTYEASELIEMKCDLCGKVSKNDDWSIDNNDVNEVELSVTVHQKQGWSCSDGGSGEEYVIDLCPDCFKNRLIPWLKSEGATIEQKEWWW